MRTGNTEQRWGWMSQGLHWAMVILILGNMVLGKVAEEMALSPDKLKVFLWHKSIGITVLALAVLRLAWNAWQPRPAAPEGLAAWQRWAARASHGLLYGLMIVMPLSGWALNSAANVPLKWFGWLALPSIFPPDEDWKERLGELHEMLFLLFAAIVIVHAAAALKHHFLDRDTVLRRMLPFGDPNS